MAFNLYFAGWGARDADEYLRSKKANRLLSWVNEGRVIDWWRNVNLSDKLFIDSGAFSVAHSNKVIQIDDYVNYIKSHTGVDTWAELDVIPYPILNQETAKYCSEKSWENYVYMKKELPDKTILPLYHFGEPESGLERILNTEINGKKPEYIGIGGRHGVSTDTQIEYFHEVFCIIKQSSNPDVKVHAFGITVPRILEKFPFYSADSSTWVQVAISGSILTEDLQSITLSDGSAHRAENIQNMPNEVIELVGASVEKYGYTFQELCTDYKQRLRYNIDVLLNWEANYVYKGPKQFTSNRLF